MKRITFVLMLMLPFLATGQPVKVSENQRFLLKADGKPFFWLGDTAWELFHRLNREEATLYLNDRVAKGFNVVQAVVLAELDGIRVPNAYGDLPLKDQNPTKPNEAYFTHVDFIVEKANSLGITVALLPTWGDKVHRLGKGPQVFTKENAQAFGEFLGKRYRSRQIVWVLGGDRPPEDEQQEAIWHSMAAGLEKGHGNSQLMTYHIWGGHSSSEFFHDAEWLDFNMIQSGHGHGFEGRNFELVERDYRLTPAKPTLEGEARYEDIPINFNIKNSRFTAFDVRQASYWAVLSGSLGITYGNNNIWQMYDKGREGIVWARTPWHIALHHPGAQQMGYLRWLFESRAFLLLTPDQSCVKDHKGAPTDLIRAARASDGSYLIAYTPFGEPLRANLEKLSGTRFTAWWFDPREGTAEKIEAFERGDLKEKLFFPPSSGRENDWVLVVDDAARNFPEPGKKQ